MKTAAGLLAVLGCSGASGGYAGGSPSDAGAERNGAEVAGGGFVAVAPCPAPADYVGSPTTVVFGGTTGYVYAPACLEVPSGTTVTFVGDFASHPLSPSALRGTRPGNPITNVSAGASASFRFSVPGLYAYFCGFHGTLDDGTGMAGVVRVSE
jgi:plastocyanin